MDADVIIVGTGGVGSAAAFHLANRGLRVIGLDRFPGGHDRGSSHGQSRIIRLAYFEHPDYVPLLFRAYDHWADLERRCGKKLFHQVGFLEVGPPDGALIPGVLASSQKYRLPLNQLDEHAFRQRFPGFVLPEGSVALFEQRAGLLLVEECVRAHLAEAKRLGAVFYHGEEVRDWSATGDSVTVATDRNAYTAGALILTAGPWAGQVLTNLRLPLQVRRKHLHWLRGNVPEYDLHAGCPCYYFETSDGSFYGMPQIDARGVKVAEHTGGAVVADPLADDRLPEPRDTERVLAFTARTMPRLSRDRLEHAVCYYTMTPDENFIVDRHPEHANVALAAGLSGHGFKFAPVLGEVLADLATTGQTALPIGFLGLGRFSRGKSVE